MRALLADLGETYRRSSIGQLKVLLGSIFPFGAGDANYFEPQLESLLAYFNKLMVAYQSLEEEADNV